MSRFRWVGARALTTRAADALLTLAPEITRLRRVSPSLPLSFSPYYHSPPLMPATRCPWPTKPLDIAYHDTEWGVPHHDDRALFELITLEGAQAGLSWSTVLAKREHYRRAFEHFDAAKIARYDAANVAVLLADAGIVRNRQPLGRSLMLSAEQLGLQPQDVADIVAYLKTQ